MSTERIDVKDISLTKEIFGNLDKNAKRIEGEFGVSISLQDEHIEIKGPSIAAKAAGDVIMNLGRVLEEKGRLEDSDLNYYMSMVKKGKTDIASSLLQDIVCLNSYGKPIRPKTIGQKVYLDNIDNNGIVFGIGPAGTGKTYLAMAKAVTAFKNKEVNRIVLTRPAVEAGESLGFLPGDLNEKIDPYLRPLYDALFDILGYENYLKLKEKNMIEVAPLAYMRGRTLESSYVILDEAQNTTNQQMKMFLTRLGFGSKAIITGDITQVDLPRGKKSGLLTVQKILSGIKGISFSYLTRDDIVRHPLVQQIIDAYEKYEEEND